MHGSLCRYAVFLSLLSVALFHPCPGAAQGPPDGFRIRDDGRVFDRETLDKAEKLISVIRRAYNVDVLIETVPAVPAELRTKLAKDGESRFFTWWVKEQAKKVAAEGVQGITILICQDPKYLIVETDAVTEKALFTTTNRNEAKRILIANFDANEENKGLLEALEYIKTTLGTHTAKSGATSAKSAGGNMGDNMLGWVCLGVGALLVLWVVVGLIRAFAGAGRPVDRGPGNYVGGGPGYGPGGGPGYGPGYGQPAGGGGGGFMSGLLGGMLGGAAGAWAYDSFFRGSGGGSSYPTGGGMTPTAYGGTSNPSDPQPGGTSGGTWGGSNPSDNSGGGTWGSNTDDNSGGGSWGNSGGDTGGGDWSGGGGDAGGGGDWGGGGGDAGGGGGDWGGGGGDSGGGGDW